MGHIDSCLCWWLLLLVQCWWVCRVKPTTTDWVPCRYKLRNGPGKMCVPQSEQACARNERKRVDVEAYNRSPNVWINGISSRLTGSQQHRATSWRWFSELLKAGSRNAGPAVGATCVLTSACKSAFVMCWWNVSTFHLCTEDYRNF